MTSIKPVFGPVAWPTLPSNRAVECASAMVTSSMVATNQSWAKSLTHDRFVLVSPVHFFQAASKAWMTGMTSAMNTYKLYANPGVALGG